MLVRKVKLYCVRVPTSTVKCSRATHFENLHLCSAKNRYAMNSLHQIWSKCGIASSGTPMASSNPRRTAPSLFRLVSTFFDLAREPIRFPVLAIIYNGSEIDDCENTVDLVPAKAPNFDKIQQSSTSRSQTIQQESLRINKFLLSSTSLVTWFGTRRPVVQIHSP